MEMSSALLGSIVEPSMTGQISACLAPRAAVNVGLIAAERVSASVAAKIRYVAVTVFRAQPANARRQWSAQTPTAPIGEAVFRVSPWTIPSKPMMYRSASPEHVLRPPVQRTMTAAMACSVLRASVKWTVTAAIHARNASDKQTALMDRNA